MTSKKETPSFMGSSAVPNELSPVNEAGALQTTASGLDSDLFDAVAEQVSPEDAEGYVRTQEPLVYVAIRQKDLMGGDGQVLRPKGAFRFGPTKTPSDDDLKQLAGILLNSGEIRTYFKSPDDKKPTCGSRDMQWAEEWGFKDGEGPRDCRTCKLNRLAPAFNGDMQGRCRENMQFYFYDMQKKQVLCVQFTPGAWKGWNIFASKCRRDYRQALMRKGLAVTPSTEVPWLQFILKIGIKYTDQKGGYFIPDFELLSRNEPENVALLRSERRKMVAQIEVTKAQAAAGAGMDGEDLLGATEVEHEEV